MQDEGALYRVFQRELQPVEVARQRHVGHGVVAPVELQRRHAYLALEGLAEAGGTREAVARGHALGEVLVADVARRLAHAQPGDEALVGHPEMLLEHHLEVERGVAGLPCDVFQGHVEVAQVVQDVVQPALDPLHPDERRLFEFVGHVGHERAVQAHVVVDARNRRTVRFRTILRHAHPRSAFGAPPSPQERLQLSSPIIRDRGKAVMEKSLSQTQ